MRKPRNPALETPLEGLGIYHDEFLATRKEELVGLINALKVGDFPSMAILAHQWKGVSAPYGFGELGHIATELEKCAELLLLEECAALIQEAKDYLESRS